MLITESKEAVKDTACTSTVVRERSENLASTSLVVLRWGEQMTVTQARIKHYHLASVTGISDRARNNNGIRISISEKRTVQDFGRLFEPWKEKNRYKGGWFVRSLSNCIHRQINLYLKALPAFYAHARTLLFRGQGNSIFQDTSVQRSIFSMWNEGAYNN